jgi:trehalose transport system substrate-binding protein
MALILRAIDAFRIFDIALVLDGDVFGLMRGTPNRDMALDCARYFMSNEIQETLTTQLGWPAIRTDAFGAVEEWQQPDFESVKLALEQTRPRPNVVYWIEVEQILSDAFHDIVTEGADAHDAEATSLTRMRQK